jgi:ribosomal protein S18 acetylase RimI-like enzyme
MIFIREARAEDLAPIAALRIDNWQTTYKGLLPQLFLEGLNCEKETQYWVNFSQTKNHSVFVAIDEHENLLGYVGIKPFDESYTIGEIYALHTASAFRGTGAGKALIHHAATQFKTKEINEMRLWVVKGNDKAVAIYEHLGAEIYTSQVEKIDGVDVPEMGMIWTDLNHFFAKIICNYRLIDSEIIAELKLGTSKK